MSEKLDITILDLAHRDAPLVGAWLAILDQLEDYPFYKHPAWYYALNQHLFAGSIQFVLLSDKQGPAAVLPVVRCQNRFPVNGFCTPQHDHIVLNDWIIRDKQCVKSVVANLSNVASALGIANWKELQLSGLPANSDLLQENCLLLADRTPDREQKVLIRKVRESAWFDTRSLESHFSANLRKNMRSRMRKAEAIAPVRFVFSTSRDDMQQNFMLFKQIENSGWKGATGSSTAIVQNKSLTSFYQELLDQ